jgi:hypothetical protein
MAINQKYGSYTGTCLSSDVKPTGWGAGSELYETDTYTTYIFDGSNWLIKIDGYISSDNYGELGSGFETIQVSGSSAVGLTSSLILDGGNANQVKVLVYTTQDILWRKDGVNPTSTIGMPLKSGDYLVLNTSQALSFKMIKVSTAAVVTVDYSYR